MSNTWADYLAEIKDAANEETGTDKGRFTDAQYLRKANMIVREIATETECLEGSEAMDSVNDQLEYSMGSDYAKIISVWAKDASDDDYTELVPTSMQALSNLVDRGIIAGPWMDKTADKPTHWYPRTGEGKFGVYPKFNAAVTSGLKIYYEDQITEMTASTDIPFNSIYHLYNFHRVIVYGVLANISPTLGLDTKYWSDKYEAGKAQMKNKLESDDEDLLTFSLDRPVMQQEASDIEKWYKE